MHSIRNMIYARRTVRRFLSLLLVLSLFFTIVPTAGAADLIFLAVNDTIPGSLSSASMPFYSGGLLYVPLSLFDADALGIIPVYDSASRILTLSGGSRSLVFDLDGGTVVTEAGADYSAQVISRSGVLFVPASYCASHFGIGISYLTSISGYEVIRFTTGSQVYDDSLFIEKAENLISYRAGLYLGTDSSESGQTSAKEEASSQAEQPQSEETQTAAASDDSRTAAKSVCLYFAVTNATAMEEALDAFADAELHGAFFLSREEIVLFPQLVIRILSEGHTLGLIADGSEADANCALDRLIQSKTLCYLASEPVTVPGTVFQIPETETNLEDVLNTATVPQLLVVNASEVASALRACIKAGAEVRQLRECTVF